MSQAVPILLYHRIDRSSLSTATPPTVFRRHLQWLKERGWRALTAEEFSFFMRGGKAFPPRSFVITFDDGYESISSVALSTLKEFGYHAIAFISTKLLHHEPAVGEAVPADKEMSSFMSWTQARELQASGIIDLQSHTHSHQLFTDWPLVGIIDDLTTSVDILSYELKMPRSHYTHLAWPWGRSTPQSRAAASRAGFKYQYTVARYSFHARMPMDNIPRTCFDAAAFTQFQRQFWLQSGQFSPLWRAAYPLGRRLRQFASLLS